MDLNPLQTALAAIEDRAALETKNLLKRQDDYLEALRLVDLLKKHGADDDLSVLISDHGHRCDFVVYGRHGDPQRIRTAIVSAGLTVSEVKPAYNDETKQWVVAGFEVVDLYMPASLDAPVPTLEAA